jgi:predicted Zn finger-like uncharacterized protein
VAVATQCPSCNRKLRVPENLLGKSVRCPECKETFTVHASGDESAAATGVTTRPAPAQPPPLSDDDDNERRGRRYEDPEEDDDRDSRDEEEQDGYEDRRSRGKRRRSRNREAAASAVAGPGIALMILGGLALLIAATSLALNLVGAAMVVPHAAAGPGGGDAIANVVGGVAGAVFGLCWGGIILSGAWTMFSLRAYPYAMTACIVAMLPCNLCCFLTLPFGIWGLVVLLRPEVKDAFR